jgi:prephenate dehydrogenase
VERISIIGLGLIGGSLALALKKAGTVRDIVGFSRSSETLATAKQCGIIDHDANDLSSAVKRAEMVVIAAPVMATKEILASISRHLPANCIVTDAGSTKLEVMQWAEEYLPANVSFIGGHPMAGKETSGIGEAYADLFQGCVYCLTPARNAGPQAVKTMKTIVESIGATPFFVDAELHDNLVAGVSHLPMLLSAAFVTATTRSRSWPEMAKLAAGGYRDISRLASGNPEMNRDICITNKGKIVYWIDCYIDELLRYRSLVAEDGAELLKALIQAREAREKWLRKGRP